MRGGTAITVGLILIIWCAYLWNAWTRASHWQSVPGSLVFADLRTNHHHDSNGRDDASYTADIRYRYRVNGRDFLGVRYSSASWISNDNTELARVNAVQDQQAKQGSIPVYYNPRKPGESALDVRVSPLAFLGLNAGLVLLSLGLTSAFPGRETPIYHKITTGTFLSVALLGAPYALLGWGVNTFLVVAWAVLLVLPFTGFGAPKPFRSAGRRK